MAVVEIVLVVIGIIFFVGSFFVAEKLSSSDVKKVAEMSESELKIVMDSELAEAKAKISDIVDDTIDLSINKIKRDLEKETTDKLMAIGEYSSATNEELNKANKEATMLYSMLADKHDEINRCIDELKALIEQYNELDKSIPDIPAPEIAVPEIVEPVKEEVFEQGIDATVVKLNDRIVANPAGADYSADVSDIDKRREIYALYSQGVPVVEIARQLKMGIGEVDLIIKLHKEA